MQDVIFSSQYVEGKIITLVNEYKRLFPAEFFDFQKAHIVKVDVLKRENKFAKLKNTNIVERQLGEMPETLFVLLQRNLSAEELKWFNSPSGYKWFYNHFPEFKVTGGRI